MLAWYYAAKFSWFQTDKKVRDEVMEKKNRDEIKMSRLS